MANYKFVSSFKLEIWSVQMKSQVETASRG